MQGGEVILVSKSEPVEKQLQINGVLGTSFTRDMQSTMTRNVVREARLAAN